MNKIKQQPISLPSGESGFTIIESLLAIIVVTILMIGLAPVITLAVATRVQAKRVEWATQAAQTYIDDVRQAPGDTEDIMVTTDPKVTAPAPPNPGNLTCDARDYCTSPSTDLYCVDGDGDGECTTGSIKDMIVQAFGYPNQALANQGYRSYQLGIRVYRADAFDSSNSFTPGNPQSTWTGGTGLNPDQPPLFVTTTEIVVDDIQEFRELCDAASVTGC